AVVLTARGLLYSYCRGGWIAAICGIAYFMFREVHCSSSKIHTVLDHSWLKNNSLPAIIILVSIIVVSFWHFKETDFYPVRRALSAVSGVDFSSRNRIAAWEGSLQITAEHPWCGAGWNQPESLYEHYYLPPKLSERAAFETNDHLMLGATLGVPALFCFGMYVWLCLTQDVQSLGPSRESA